MRRNFYNNSRVCLYVLLFVAGVASPARADLVKGTEGAAWRRSDVFELIDLAHLRGELSQGKRHYYKVAAVVAPHLLPESFRQIVAGGTPVSGCFTPVVVEAVQALSRMSGPERADLENLLLPPDDLAYSIETTTPFPMRVTYNDAGLASKAQQVLDAAIYSYNRLVTQWGWWEPVVEPGAEFYRFRVMNSGMGGGAYTAPYDYDPTATNCVYYTYIVVDQSLDEWSIDGTVAHEFTHACQAAMDTSEKVAFWENTATYTMSQVYPNSWMYTMYMFQYFQRYPFRPLDYMNVYNSDAYEYGGGLWAYFLSYLYANEDPTWIREVWEGSVQFGCYNEPDYFDVIDDMLEEEGGFDEMVKTFAQYRFFASTDDDGQHLPNADEWWDAEVDKIFDGTTASLPLENQGPGQNERPQPNGCNYVALRVSNNLQQPIHFEFSGDSSLLWNVDVMRIHPSTQTTFQRMEIDENGQGFLDVQNQQNDRLVMVVCQLGGETYDPDDEDWTAGDYTYSIGYVAPPPTVTSVEPATVAAGSQDVYFLVRGEGFVSDPDLTLTISGTKVFASIQQVVGTTEIQARLNVGGTAELGPRDVVVTNPGGNAGVGQGLLTIVDPNGGDGGTSGDGGSNTDDGPNKKCGCQSGTAAGGGKKTPLMLLVGLLLLGAAIRRRREQRVMR